MYYFLEKFKAHKLCNISYWICENELWGMCVMRVGVVTERIVVRWYKCDWNINYCKNFWFRTRPADWDTKWNPDWDSYWNSHRYDNELEQHFFLRSFRETAWNSCNMWLYSGLFLNVRLKRGWLVVCHDFLLFSFIEFCNRMIEKHTNFRLLSVDIRLSVFT